MSQLLALKKATTLSEVARLLDVKPAMLSFHLYLKPKTSCYTKFEIPKRHGGVREISAPEKDLKLIQYRLSLLLQNCVDEINAANGIFEDESHFGIAHGFKRKHSILTNARMHKTRRYVFNVDLHDFFGSINFGRVRGFFIKDKNFSLSEKVATVLAQIACHENKIPQGSPCSPVISNLIGHVLDIHLARLASSAGCTYTRYADDLTFSSSKPDFPISIARRADCDAQKWLPGNGLNRLVKKCGFTFNDTKTRMQYRDSRQEVTGLSVNRKINSRRDYRDTVRAMVHSLVTKGCFEHISKVKDANGVETEVREVGSRNELRGMLAFIDHVDQYNVDLYKDVQPPQLTSESRCKVYKQFLLFDLFYAPNLPVLVCEGDTDNVYLSHAIHRLIASYPKLATKKSTGETQLNIRLHKYSNRPTSRILKLEGGAPQLSRFINDYCKQIRGFTAPGGNHPVIVFIDNDDGKGEVIKAVGKITNKPIFGTEPYLHVFRNLYVVLTPVIPPATKSCIEDFFDAATLHTEHQGKTFNPAKQIDISKEYGKVVFAHKVIRPHAATINFDGFKPLLDRVQMVIDEHAKKSAIPSP